MIACDLNFKIKVRIKRISRTYFCCDGGPVEVEFCVGVFIARVDAKRFGVEIVSLLPLGRLKDGVALLLFLLQLLGFL